AESIGAAQRLVGVRTTFHGVNPVVMGGGVVRMRRQQLAQNGLGVKLAVAWMPVSFEAVHFFQSQERLGILIVRVAIDQSFHHLPIGSGVIGIVILVLVFRRPDVQLFVIGCMAGERLGLVQRGVLFLLDGSVPRGH